MYERQLGADSGARLLSSMAVPVIDDLAVDVASRLLISSAAYRWQGIIVHCYELAPHPELIYLPEQLTAHVEQIALHLDYPVTLRYAYGGHQGQERSVPGNLCVIPELSSVAFGWTGRSQILQIFLDSGLLVSLAKEICPGNPEVATLRWHFNFRDLLIQQIGLALKTDLEEDNLAGSLYAESLAQSLALHLLRNYSSLTSVRTLANHSLSSPQLKRLLAAIDDQIDQHLTLTDLAALAGISPPHLTRQFKRATGLAPHQYLTQRRVERAKELLLKGTMSIAEVAAAVGFADQSHLDRHFKRLLGISPRDIRG